MTATITLFEHEIGEFDWTDRDFAALERLNRAAGVDILRATMRGRQRVVKATQYVGVIRLGRRTIQVLPKIYQPNDVVSQQQRAREATHSAVLNASISSLSRTTSSPGTKSRACL